jgi:glutamine amidotransferase
MWTDQDAPVLARSLRSGAFVAAVRNGTVGMPVTEAACAPFTDGRWSFSHNGMVAGWPESIATPAGKLPVTDLLTLEAPTDSAVLWALLRERLRAGEDPVRATVDLLTRVERAAPGSRLNFLLTDGEVLVATAWTHSLWVWRSRAGPPERGDAVVVASEPPDTGPGWTPVPDRHTVVAWRGGLDLIPLDADRSRNP